MFSRIRWRELIFLSILILGIMGGLGLVLDRQVCLSDPACVRQSIRVATILMLALSLTFAIINSERLLRPIRQLTNFTLRVRDGELSHPLLLVGRRDEISELTLAISEMAEVMGQQISNLTEERRQLAFLATYMADGVLIADEMGYIQLINPAAAQLLNSSQKKAKGQSLAEVFRHHQLIELWQRCQLDGEKHVEAIEVGAGLFLQASITPFQELETKGFLVILQDLTRIRRLETVRRDFISNISHELRTPLASLRAVVETLRDGALEDPPAARRFLSRAENEVDTLTQMVQELLELSRIESGHAPLQIIPTEVNSLLKSTVERLAALVERKKITLTLEVHPNLPSILADAERVQQVLTNLIHNAIKFTPAQGKVTVKAYTDSQKQPESKRKLDVVVFVVNDTGSGISAKDLPRIFERFYKSDPARTRGRSGTGLGLAIARHIVQAHNGRIWVNSKEGKGSTFYFTIPVSPLD